MANIRLFQNKEEGESQQRRERNECVSSNPQSFHNNSRDHPYNPRCTAVAIRVLTRVSIKKAGRQDCHVSIIHTDMFVNVDSPLASLARGDTHSFARTRNAKASSPAASAIYCDRSFAAGNAVCRSATALILPGGRITASVASFAAASILGLQQFILA